MRHTLVELAQRYPNLHLGPAPPTTVSQLQPLRNCVNSVRDAYHSAQAERLYNLQPDSAAKARLLSAQSRAGNIWLDTIPTQPAHRLAD